MYKHASNVEQQPNMWQQRPNIRQNIGTVAGAVASVGRIEQSSVNLATTPVLDMNQIVLNLSRQMETISEKLQFLELKKSF